ncbi:hypothetical protein RND81_07G072600 [Saponaria officinalis]|uniref:Uncharacterized protein n=1 Tax=Saponaria officinalis TaxID=3572 RepID=A0AAW1JSP3_SAPOF
MTFYFGKQTNTKTPFFSFVLLPPFLFLPIKPDHHQQHHGSPSPAQPSFSPTSLIIVNILAVFVFSPFPPQISAGVFNFADEIKRFQVRRPQCLLSFRRLLGDFIKSSFWRSSILILAEY